MKVIGVFICLLSAAVSAEYCYDSQICVDKETFPGCSATYGDFPALTGELSQFMDIHLNHSYQYLLLASYFKNFVTNRPGFEKLYRKFAEETWEKSIDLIKYITKRGGTVKFSQAPEKFDFQGNSLNLKEMESLAVVLDAQKLLANQANEIHRRVMKNIKHDGEQPEVHHEHDAEVGSYLENHFVHKLADNIRDLSGYANDLIGLLAKKQQTDSSLALYLFDEYLQKAL